MAKNRKLIASLRIRNRLTGTDLVAFAKHLSEEPEKAEDFESLLKTQSHLLSHEIIAALEAVPFLRARSGVLAAPSNLHLDNPINRICAGTDNRIVAGRNVLLYKRLGCRERPSASTMLQVLSEARKQDQPPPHPEIFYPTLVLALHAESQAVDGHATDRILRIEDAYHAPQDVLVGPHVPSCFVSTVPYLRSPSVIVNAFASLGAASHPTERHWVRLFSWSHDRYGPNDAVPSHARRLLIEAYQRRGHSGLPSDVGNTIRCLLGRDHKLHTRHDVHEARLIEDDFPALSAALVEQGANIQFADLSEASRNFFQALGLKRLTSIAPTPSVSVGPEGNSPTWFQSQHAEQVLTLIRRDDFAQALDLLAYAHQRESGEFRAISRDDLSLKLSRIERIAFVARIDRIYTVGGKSVTIETEATALPDRIALKPMRSKFELEQYLASALAELVGAQNLTDARRISLAILPLLRCQTSADMFVYLERQGLKPNSWIDLDVPAAEPTAEADESISPEAEGLRQMVDQMFAKARANTQDSLDTDPITATASPNSRTSTPSPPSPAFVVPCLDAVQATVLEPTDHGVAVRSPSYSTSSGSDRQGNWAPRDWNAIERDRQVGERGEEIIYRLELERVRQLGHAIPEQHVVWTSKTDPGADHDIRSIDDDGKPIWIEVKSTTGTDGRFDWPQREFEKALREGKRYILWRVYEAHTEHPTAKPFRDPAGLFARSALRLEISGLRGFVEPKCT